MSHAGMPDEPSSEAAVAATYSKVAQTYADNIRGTNPEQPLDLAMIAHFVQLSCSQVGDGVGVGQEATRAVADRQLQVLDAGCGAGRMLPHLANLFATCETPGSDDDHAAQSSRRTKAVIEGIDLSEGMASRARADCPHFDIKVGSLAALPYEDSRFDAVFAWYSIIHTPVQARPVILRELHRVTKPLSHVLLAFQTGNDARDVAAGFRARGHNVSLMRYHQSLSALAAQAERAGFVIRATMDRAPVPPERDGQAVIICQK